MADIRKLMESALDDLAADDPDSVRSFIREAFTLEKTKEVWVAIVCKHCRRTGKYKETIQIPDYTGQAKALSMLMNQAKGQPKETVKVTVDVGIRPVTEMSLAELEAEERALLSAHPELAQTT